MQSLCIFCLFSGCILHLFNDYGDDAFEGQDSCHMCNVRMYCVCIILVYAECMLYVLLGMVMMLLKDR